MKNCLSLFPSCISISNFTGPNSCFAVEKEIQNLSTLRRAKSIFGPTEVAFCLIFL